MRKFLLVGCLFFTTFSMAFAEPDFYYGDANVFTGSSVNVPANIMFFIDTSSQMVQRGSTGVYKRLSGDPYPPTGHTNSGAPYYLTDKIYYKQNNEYKETQLSLNQIDQTDPIAKELHDKLRDNGNELGCLTNQGKTCTNKTESYYSGDYLNWQNQSSSAEEWRTAKEYSEGVFVYPAGGSSSGQVYLSIKSGTSGAVSPFPSLENLDKTKCYVDSGGVVTSINCEDSSTVGTDVVVWEPQISIIEVIENAMNQTIFPFLLNQNVRVGLMKYGGGGVQGNQGGEVVAPVDAHSLGTLQNYMSSNIAQAALLQNANSQPLGAAMWDAWLYWVGNPTGGGDHANSQYQGNDPDLKSPIQHWCQPNHMIVIATGASFENIGTSNPIAKLNKDGVDDGFYLPEASTYLYNNLDYVVQGNQARVKTHVIQMMTSKLARMEEAAGNGRGLYRNVTDSKAILDALTEIILAILEADSSFVAPVVPANPENQAYSGDRIYLGFFKPMNDEPWCGNIKKFALDHQNRMLGFNSSGDLVSAVDQYGDFVVDQFDQPAVSSFWSPQNLDGGLVDAGGVGERLLLRSFDRNIYTLPTSPTANTQLQDLELSSISASTLDVAIEGDTEASDEAATKLINFIYGSDSYGEYPDGDGKRRWIKGDVMHSKPVILNYNNYPFTEANESNATINKSYIFVGGNDGMLHAYRDVDGSEAWAFVPPELLPNLKYLRDYERHHYYIDGSPVIYVHDANGDGCIGTMVEDAEGDLSCSVGVGSDDKAILLFGMRRGGGSSTLGGGTSGSTYYALDITMPDNPKFLWRINSATTGFSEMGQTWSLPTPAKMKIGSHTKIVAVIGGGYDTNEDLRYGSIQSFPESNSDTVTSLAPSGEGAVTSPGGKDQHNPTGRAVYFVDIATLNESGISLSGSGSLIWAATDSNMLFSFPSDPLVVDSNFDGYADTVYVGDTGGQLWRLDVNSPTEIETKWKATRIFVANSGNTDMGRKIFYKPTATINGHDTFIFFGTGDREHPLNTAVTDRFYMVRDRRVPFYITDNSTISDYNKTHSLWNYSSPLSETNLVDVTENDLQDGNLTEEAAKTFRAKLSPPFFTDGTTTYYGWYIMLDEEFHDGEKVLASPRVFDGKVFFTTYQPTAHTQENDPCVGVLGPARLYIVDMFTGEAVFNLYKGNDQIDGTPVLERRDRYLEPGRGIASEPIVRVDKFGNVSVLVGRGGGFFNSAENPDVDLGTFDPLYPIYWMKW